MVSRQEMIGGVIVIVVVFIIVIILFWYWGGNQIKSSRFRFAYIYYLSLIILPKSLTQTPNFSLMALYNLYIHSELVSILGIVGINAFWAPSNFE